MFQDIIPEGFIERLQTYCHENEINWAKLALTENEIFQLCWYEMSNANETPQAQLSTQPLNFDIQRAISRIYCHVLLESPTEENYNAFTAKQAEPKLSRENFEKLVRSFQKFTSDEKIALRKTCLFTLKTGVSDQRIKQAFPTISLETDSEKFLTQVVNELRLENLQLIFPLFRDLQGTHVDILKQCYWPNSHFRHLLFTEGNDQMMTHLKKANKEQSRLWYWRWVLNIAAFNSQVGDNLNEAWYQAVNLARQSIKQAKQDPGTSYLTLYLTNWSQKYSAIFSEFTEDEKRWIMHIALFSTKELLTAPQMTELAVGMQFLKQNYPELVSKILENYKNFCESKSSVTPTYTPSLFTNAWSALKKEEYSQTLSEMNFTPLSAAMVFASFALSKIYQQASQGSYISCLDCSKEPNLSTTLSDWLNNSMPSLNLAVNDSGQARCYAPTRRASATGTM